jgi:hypothetical protein
MIFYEATQICAAALLGEFTVVGIIFSYLVLCAVCELIARTLSDNIDDILPR